MVKTRAVQVRLTIDQHNTIKAEAKANGFHHLSDFIRWRTLQKGPFIEKKVIETHKLIREILDNIHDQGDQPELTTAPAVTLQALRTKDQPSL